MIKKACFGLIASITGFSSLVYANTGSTNKDQPSNILIITCHDLGQHLGCYGIPTVNSPNIDKLAANGVMFKNFCSTSAVCSPGRASLFTGRYPQSNGMMGLLHAPWWWVMNEGEVHMAQLLKEKGYETTLIGFTHVGEPHELGFEKHLSVKRNAEESVSEAINFFLGKENKGKPFFVKVGFTEVHSPYKNGPDSLKGVFIPGYLQNTKEIRQELIKFQGSIKYLDQCIGRILEAVQDSKVRDNTIVIFTSDHGIGFPGAKWTARKAGLEVPFIIYQPNSIFSGGKVFSEPMSNVDVLPTLLNYMNFEIPSNIEGVSFKSFIAGETLNPPRQVVFGQYTADMKRDNESRTVINNKYQLIWYFCAGRTVDFPLDADPEKFAQHIIREKTTGTRPFYELFDLENDPWAIHNLGESEDNKEIIRNLSTELLDWMKSVDDPLLRGPVATPYYEKSMEDLMNITK